MERKELDKAEKCFGRIYYKLKDESVQTLCSLAEVSYQKGDLGKGEELLLKAHNLYPIKSLVFRVMSKYQNA